VNEGTFDILNSQLPVNQYWTNISIFFCSNQRSFCELYSQRPSPAPHTLASLTQSKQVYVQPPTSAVNVTLLTFAAEHSATVRSVTPLLMSIRRLPCPAPTSLMSKNAPSPTQCWTLPHDTQQQIHLMTYNRGRPTHLLAPLLPTTDDATRWIGLMQSRLPRTPAPPMGYPMSITVTQSLSWENAFLKSTKHIQRGCWCSRALCISIPRFVIWSLVPFPCRNHLFVCNFRFGLRSDPF